MPVALRRLAAVLAILLGVPAASAKRPLAVFHTSVNEAIAGKDLELTANVPRYRDIDKLLVRYRRKGTTSWGSITLRRTQGDFFEGKIPGGKVRVPGLEYFLMVITRDGVSKPMFASPSKPQRVKVLPGGKKKRPRTALEETLAVFTEGQVVSAARQVQPIEESPSAITVITAEDIRNYGATSIAEVLRIVPGMDYMQISGTDPNLSVRGFNRELSNRLLTLIDGRSAYVDIFGMTFWEVLPISVWEIDRIEVIRGPGSTLYGANAFGGVVNIFTKPPEKTRGMHVYLQGGAHGFNTTIMAAGTTKENKVAYRMAVTHDQISSFDRVTVDDKFGVRGNALIRFNLPDNAKLTLRGGLIRQTFGPTMSLNGPFDVAATLGFAQVNLEWKNLRFQTWYTGIKADLDRRFPIPKTLTLPGLGTIPLSSIFGPFEIKGIPGSRPDTIDAELTYTLQPIKMLRMTFGANYRFNNFDIPALIETLNRQHLFGVFGQFELRPHPSLNINLGAGYYLLNYGVDVCPRAALDECVAGNVPKVGVDALQNFSPRGALVWGFAKNHYLRLSGGIAFRNPSFTENLIRFEVAPSAMLPDGRIRPAINFAGNEKLGLEEIRSGELGYGASFLNKRLRLNVDLFYLEGLGLIQFQSGSLLAALSGLAPLSSTYRNLVDARNYGFEISLRARFTSWLKAFFNYSYQRVELINRSDIQARIDAGEFGPGITRVEDITTINEESPQHKFNVGINIDHRPSGFFLNIYGHFVGATRRRNLFTALPDSPVDLGALTGGAVPIVTTLGALTGSRALEQVDRYFLLNINLGYRLYKGQLEVGVAGFNVLGAYDNLNGDGLVQDPVTGQLNVVSRRHIEYPRLNMQGDIFGGEAIGARVFGFLRARFR